MSGRPAYDRETYAEDIAALRRRGLSWPAIATELGISRATLSRIRQETSR